MPRTARNQWDFGDLFAERPKASADSPPPSDPARSTPSPLAPPVVLSVTELTLGIKRQLESSFVGVRVRGEISNFRLQSSGHAYFVLKDANAQLSCVLFRSQAGADRSQLKDGAKVTLGGEITVYEPRGQYQLRVTSVELEGIGALQAAFERLKARLQAEGLFETARKRPIPAYPRRVGLVTSPTGAALRDVLHVVERRFAGLEFVLVPVRVQGEGAAEEIAAAVGRLNAWATQAPGGLDVILITRGGGSLEDLWAFNEEVVARALADSSVPVISAVGHEIDFTIADFVADQRAATPSAAAEILTAGYVAGAGRVADSTRRLGWLIRRDLQDRREAIASRSARLARRHPRRQLEARAQRLDDLTTALVRASGRRVREVRLAWEGSLRRLAARQPTVWLTLRRRALIEARRRLMDQARRGWERSRERWERAQRALFLLSPLTILERGYSLTFDQDTGRLVRSAAQVTPGRPLRTRLGQGEIISVVEATKPSPPKTEHTLEGISPSPLPPLPRS